MNRKILLSDDDLPVRLMVARVLRAGGYDVVLAGSAREAVAEFRDARPDLVLLDLKTSGLDGWQAFDEIRRLSPAVPVIATTALSNQCEQAVQRGIDALMEKPLDLPLLLSLISQLLAEPEAVRTERSQKRMQLESARAAA